MDGPYKLFLRLAQRPLHTMMRVRLQSTTPAPAKKGRRTTFITRCAKPVTTRLPTLLKGPAGAVFRKLLRSLYETTHFLEFLLQSFQ